MGASKRWLDPDNPVDCGPYGEAYWCAEKRRWFRRATEDGKAYLAQWWKSNNPIGIILAAPITRGMGFALKRAIGEEDFYSLCEMVPIETIPRWNPERSVFNTALVQVARSMFSGRFWTVNSKQRTPPPMVSLEEPVGEDLRLRDIVPGQGTNQDIEQVDNQDSVCWLFSRLSKTSRGIVNGLIRGESLRVIGESLGMTEGAIEHRIRRLAKVTDVRQLCGITEDE